MERTIIGWKELRAIDGERGVTTVARVRETSPALADALIDHAFGEIFARAELGRRERELITVGILGAMGGCEPQLRIHLEAALNVGVDPDELIAIAEHLSIYGGFPRALNVLRETRSVLEELGRPLPLGSDRVRLGDHETLVTDTLVTDTLVTDTGGEKPPIVLIHALGLDRRVWRDVIPALRAEYRVIAYDLRGHGHAAGAPPVRLLSDFAQDLGCLLDGLGVDSTAVVGLSLGGAVAQAFTLAHPDRVTGLGILASTAWSHPAFLARAEAAERDGMAAQVVPTLTRWFTPQSLAENGWAVRYARDRVARNIVADWAASWRTLAALDHGDRLGTITVPTFIVAGADDPSTPPALSQKMATLIPNAHYAVIEAASHMLPLERPDAVARSILRGLQPGR